MFLAPPSLCAFARAVPIIRCALLSRRGWEPHLLPSPPSRSILRTVQGPHWRPGLGPLLCPLHLCPRPPRKLEPQRAFAGGPGPPKSSRGFRSHARCWVGLSLRALSHPMGMPPQERDGLEASPTPLRQSSRSCPQTLRPQHAHLHSGSARACPASTGRDGARESSGGGHARRGLPPPPATHCSPGQRAGQARTWGPATASTRRWAGEGRPQWAPFLPWLMETVEFGIFKQLYIHRLQGRERMA